MTDNLDNSLTDNDLMNKNRLFWASRRGMLELDIIFQAFLEKPYDGLAVSEKLLYQNLLLNEDQDLFAWLMGHGEPEDRDTATIIDIIRTSVRGSGG